MKTVISAKDIEDLLHDGRDVKSLPADAIFTPSARDLLRDVLARNAGQSKGAHPAASSPAQAVKVTSRSPKAEIEAFFNSPAINELKEQICEVGRRLWQREYVDGNGGNIAIRVGEDIALCTPTLVSKGFMKPADMCLVDLEGNQLAGEKKRTSEILMHLQMMKRQPKMAASVHCHPPYATGFAVAGVTPPTCMVPEFEVFCAVAVAPYRTPGTPEMGKLVADLVEQHNTILMANHGVVSWSHLSVEDAYFKMEILEAYCRTILVAYQLGDPGGDRHDRAVQAGHPSAHTRVGRPGKHARHHHRGNSRERHHTAGRDLRPAPYPHVNGRRAQVRPAGQVQGARARGRRPGAHFRRRADQGQSAVQTGHAY